ncbi:MAG: hypothetical protein ABH886_05665 [Candidatus Desantisbacteria bacterium]
MNNKIRNEIICVHLRFHIKNQVNIMLKLIGRTEELFTEHLRKF